MADALVATVEGPLGKADLYEVTRTDAHGVLEIEYEVRKGNEVQKFPALGAKIFDRGEVRMHLNVYLNSEDIRYLDELATKTKDGDELDIIPAVAGG